MLKTGDSNIYPMSLVYLNKICPATKKKEKTQLGYFFLNTFHRKIVFITELKDGKFLVKKNIKLYKKSMNAFFFTSVFMKNLFKKHILPQNCELFFTLYF